MQETRRETFIYTLEKDSGGWQEEHPFVTCLIIGGRKSTETIKNVMK